MGFRFDKPDRIRFFSSMFCGMASDKADNPINLHRKGRMTSPGQALLFFRSAASAVRPDIAGRRVCLDRPPQYRPHCPVSIVNFAIIPISSAKILFSRQFAAPCPFPVPTAATPTPTTATAALHRRPQSASS